MTPTQDLNNIIEGLISDHIESEKKELGADEAQQLFIRRACIKMTVLLSKALKECHDIAGDDDQMRLFLFDKFTQSLGEICAVVAHELDTHKGELQ